MLEFALKSEVESETQGDVLTLDPEKVGPGHSWALIEHFHQFKYSLGVGVGALLPAKGLHNVHKPENKKWCN